MGATSWHCFTSYQPDAEAALQRLRAEVFARSAYIDPAGSPAEYVRQRYEQLGLGGDSPECRAAIEEATRGQRFLETASEEDLRGVPRSSRAAFRRARELMNLVGQTPRRARRRPRTIDEVLERAAECGTHSILDITRTADRRGHAAAAPLTERELRRVFRTLEPTRHQVEDRWDEIAEKLDRWQACYFVVYQDGVAREYAFVGCSGD
ncbi:MAG TPA: hypothetical protein VL371_12325 [Gemmataceae bacterium]|nr:hypothetical protein [Gemmataceae bacterium]